MFYNGSWLLNTSSGISMFDANLLTSKTIDIRISIEIDKFREHYNLRTHAVNIFPIVARKKYWRWTIFWIHPVINSITTEIWT